MHYLLNLTRKCWRLYSHLLDCRKKWALMQWIQINQWTTDQLSQFRLLFMHMCSTICIHMIVYCVSYELNWELKTYISQMYTTCAVVFNKLRSCKHSTILVLISNETSFESALWVITVPVYLLVEEKMTDRTIGTKFWLFSRLKWSSNRFDAFFACFSFTETMPIDSFQSIRWKIWFWQTSHYY